MARGLVPRGHLVFCHYERSEVIQIQVLLANRLLHSFRVRNDMFRGVIANVVWRSVGDEIASTTPQVWLVADSHLGFAKKSFHSIASDKNRAASVELVSRLPRRVFCTARNDKRHAASFLASDKNRGTKNLRQV